MSNRMKEEERIERIIRNLLKLPENRRCINCNSLVRIWFSHFQLCMEKFINTTIRTTG